MTARTLYKEPQDLLEAIEALVLETDVVLDIGCGIMPMNYFRPKLHIMVEPWHEYVEILDHRHGEDKSVLILKAFALDALAQLCTASVDSVFLLDVIEHLEKEDGQRLIAEIERVAREQAVIFTPLGFMPQHMDHEEKDGWGLSGVELQEHRSGWTPEDFGEHWHCHVCETFHRVDFRNQPLEKPHGAFFAVFEPPPRVRKVPTAQSAIRRPPPSRVEIQQSREEVARLSRDLTSMQQEREALRQEGEALRQEREALCQEGEALRQENAYLNRRPAVRAERFLRRLFR